MVDAVTTHPLPAATIYLTSEKDSLHPLISTYSDATGHATLTDLPAGTYRLTVTMLGYQSFQQSLELNGVVTTQVTAALLPSSLDLATVDVTASRTTLEVGVGKQVLRIGSDLMSDGSSVLEALEGIPAVETNLRGDIRVRGSSDVVIFINGKPSRKTGSDLASLPASLISHIELITNPSAEYDAAGVAGIINVIMRKERRLGIHLLATVGGRVPVRGPGLRYEAGLNGSLNYGKLSATVGLAGLSSKSRNQTITDRRNLSQQTEIARYEHFHEEVGTWVDLDATATINYDIDTSSALELGYTYQRWNTESAIEQQDRFQTFTGSKLSVFTENVDDATLNEEVYTASYVKSFRENSRKLSVFFSHSTEEEDNLTRFNTEDVAIAETPLTLSISRDDEQQRERVNLLRAQFDTPLGSLPGKALLGMQSTWVNYTTLQQLAYYREALQTGANAFTIDQTIHALYLLHEKEAGELKWKIGVRAESYQHDGVQRLGDSLIEDRYLNVFPSVQLSQSLGEVSTLSGSYSYRIDRPIFRQINPYLSFDDPLNVRTGNPFLQPQFAHRVELSYRAQFPNDKVVVSVFGHKINNTIQRIAAEQGDRVLLTYTNIGTNRRVGATLFYGASPTAWLQLNQSAAVYHDAFRDPREALLRFTSNTTYNARLEQVVSLKSGWKLQLQEYYYAPARGIQETKPHRFYANLAIRKTSKDKRLSVSLQATDVFGTQNIIETTITPDLELRRELVYQFQRVGVNVSYKLVE